MTKVARINDDGELVIDTYALWQNADPDYMAELAQHEIFHKRLIEGVVDVLTEAGGYMWEHDYRGGWRFDSGTVDALREKVMECAPEVVRTAFRAAVSHGRHYWANYWRERDYAQLLERDLRNEKKYAEWLEEEVSGALDEDAREPFMERRARRTGRTDSLGSDRPYGPPPLPDRPSFEEGYHTEAEDEHMKAKVEALLEKLEASDVDFTFEFPEKETVAV